MAQDVLFVTKNDIVRFTALNGNVDVDKYLQFVKVAQDLNIQSLLGTKLFEKIKNDIIAGTLADPYLSLLNDKIKPMVIHYAMVDICRAPAGALQISIGNKGIFKHTSETGQVVDKAEVDLLVEKSRSLAEHYAQRFIDFMNYNQVDFPEYYTNTNDDIYPTRNNGFNGWYL